MEFHLSLGSTFLRSLYGCTDNRKDEITGTLYYDGHLLSSADFLMLVSYIDKDSWLCDSLTVDESIEQTMKLNVPSWV